ncbi:hypothetical protein ACHAXM_008010 [Skeletonema potamos]|jgi:hypothetical protein
MPALPLYTVACKSLFILSAMKTSTRVAVLGALATAAVVEGFAPAPQTATTTSTSSSSSSALHFFGGGTGAKDLDEEWERQQELLKLRRASPEDREKYFKSVDDRRIKATEEQIDKWAWQKKQYAKGEDPIDEWRKRRESGQISDLENQYGDPKKIGGIPLPMASFGVGGEFGVGGKFDNGGRFDLRLPYAEQGWVDEDAEENNFFANLFGGGKKKEEKVKEPVVEKTPEPKKNGFWPF